jgi:tRNA A-37 threonylcarbamoyl transferase component Bud32
MKYRLTEKIGSGGMAEVFRATGVGPDGFERPFVIKRIHPRLSEAPEFVRMFVHEAKISARLIHPNIVQVFELAYQDGAHYMVMEPVEGMDMGWLLKRRRERPHESLSPTFVAEVGRQVCRGLDFAHTLTTAEGEPLRIVHRDVTPPNIMVAWNGTVKVLDFGIARAAEAIRPSLTDPGMVKGKMSYVAPELLEGKTADARSDLFSLGAVLHELLTGRQLFSGQNDLETLNQVKEKQIPPPSAFNPGVKPALDGVVLRALSRDPDKRYASAGEMGDELEELVLRKNYSPRLLGDKARDLAQEEGETAAAGTIARAVAPGTVADAPGPVPAAVGREDSSVIVDESRGRAKPPALPAAAARAQLSRRSAALWVTVAALCLVSGALLGAALRGSGAEPAVAAAPPPAFPPVETARVALDSAPQGATVVAAVDGQRLGETPLLLTLPRGQTTLEVVLHKAGFAPQPFKVIPHQDKDVVARLEPLVPPAPPPQPTKVARARHAVKRPPPSSGPALVPGRTAPPLTATRPAATSVPPPRSAGPAVPPRPAAPTPVPPRPVATIPTTRR